MLPYEYIHAFLARFLSFIAFSILVSNLIYRMNFHTTILYGFLRSKKIGKLNLTLGKMAVKMFYASLLRSSRVMKIDSLDNGKPIEKCDEVILFRGYKI